jgi:hypothetical protein
MKSNKEELHFSHQFPQEIYPKIQHSQLQQQQVDIKLEVLNLPQNKIDTKDLYEKSMTIEVYQMRHDSQKVPYC